MNDFLSLVKTRYSCRSYSSRPVERAAVEKVLEACRLAPSACNNQPWHFIVATSEASKSIVCRAASKFKWVEQASLAVVVLGNHNEAWHRGLDGKDATDIDAAITCEHLVLAAHEQGLGTCWICSFDPEVIRQGFNLEPGVEPIAIFPIGYPAENTQIKEKRRKDMGEIVTWM